MIRNLMERRVSMVSCAVDTRTTDAGVGDILAGIRDGRWAAEVQRVRDAVSAGREDEAAELKRRLPGVLWAGRFDRRHRDGLQEASGLVVLDFDGLPEPQATRDRMHGAKHILAAFVSPGGAGLKIVALVDNRSGKHLLTWRAASAYVEDVFGLAADPSGKDVARLCFVSHDAGIVLNEDVEPLIVADEPAQPPPPPLNPKPATRRDHGRDTYGLAALEAEAALVARAAKGTRNATLNASAFKLGQLVGAGALDESIVTRELLAAAEGCGLPHAEAAATIRSGLASGRREPRRIPDKPTRGAPVPVGEDEQTTIRARLWEIGAEKGLAPSEKNTRMADCVVGWLKERGQFYRQDDKEGFESCLYFDSLRKVLIPILGDVFAAWLAQVIAVNRALPSFRFISAAVETEAMTNGILIHPSRYWAACGGKVYISSGPGHMVRVGPGTVDEVDNGTDGVLFPASSVCERWALSEPRNPFEECRLFRDMKTSAPHGKLLFELFALSLPFDQANKPELVLTSPVGGGKTSLARGLFYLYGLPETVGAVTKDGEKDFWVGMHRGGLFVADNADTRIDWLADALAAASTGGSYSKRTLYTDDAMTILRPNAWVIVTSADPHFAADPGLADRLIVVRLLRRDGVTQDNALKEEITAGRDAFLSFVALTLSEALADTAPTPGGLNKRHPDFASLAVRVGRALGRENEAVAALAAAEGDKSRFNIENDSIGQVLLSILQTESFSGSAHDLLEKIIDADPSLDGKLSAKRLGKRLDKLWPHLVALVGATKEADTHKKTMLYRFKQQSAGFAGFEAAFSQKSSRENKAGTLSKTPFETPQTPQDAPTLGLEWEEV